MHNFLLIYCLNLSRSLLSHTVGRMFQQQRTSLCETEDHRTTHTLIEWSARVTPVYRIAGVVLQYNNSSHTPAFIATTIRRCVCTAAKGHSEMFSHSPRIATTQKCKLIRWKNIRTFLLHHE